MHEPPPLLLLVRARLIQSRNGRSIHSVYEVHPEGAERKEEAHGNVGDGDPAAVLGGDRLHREGAPPAGAAGGIIIFSSAGEGVCSYPPALLCTHSSSLTLPHSPTSLFTPSLISPPKTLPFPRQEVFAGDRYS